MTHPLRNRSFLALTASQFLGAFNDNVFRQFILLLALNIQLDWLPGGGDSQALVTAVFSIPFVIFALFSGSVADRFSKRAVIVTMNITEIAVMALGMVAFALHVWLGRDEDALSAAVLASLVVLFLMGTQSIIFGPAKYGLIPELIPNAQLTRANGIITMTTNMAIVFGALVAGNLKGFLADHQLPHYVSGYFFVSVATLGWLASLFIRRVPAADPDRKLALNVFALPAHAWQELRYVAKDKQLFAAILANAWFYLVGALALQIFNVYGRDVLGNKDSGGSQLFMWVGLGIAAGSLLAGWISNKRIELGLTPFGAVAMATGFGFMATVDTALASGALAFSAGVGGGIYLVPLATFIQKRPSPKEKGRVLGVLELTSFVFVFGSAIVYALMSNVLGLDARQMCWTLGILTIAGSGLITVRAPVFLQRALLLLLRSTIYRIKVIGGDNVPEHGGALIVSNHVSYADPFLIASASHRTPRFLMHRDFVKVPLVGSFTRLCRVIPVAGTDGPRALLRSLETAAEHAANGDLVAIFAEGSITRSGNMLPFSKGLERIAKAANVPIIPVYLDQVWGSLFSFHRGKAFFKLPRRLPYPVTVAFGKPLAPDAATHQVRRAVQELSVVTAESRKRRGETLATRFLSTARRHPRRLAMADSTGQELTFRRLLAGVLALRSALKTRLSTQQYIGVLLPSTVVGNLVNITLTLMGKIPVNLNFTAGPESYEASLRKCGIETIITSRVFVKKIRLADDPRHLFVEDVLGGLKSGQKLRAYLKTFLPSAVLGRLPGVPRDPDVVATVIFSSGSTGDPKGVCLSHHNLLSNIRSLFQVLSPGPNACIVGVLPFFHSFGYTATIWLPLVRGFLAAYHPSPIDARGIQNVIEKYRGTIFISTPTFFQSYLRRFDPEAVKTLRLCVSGAEALKGSLLDGWRARFGIDIHQGYGCTELSPAVGTNIPDIQWPGVHQIGHKDGTIGHPIPGVAPKIVDPDSRQELPPGTEGMLLIKSPSVMVGYLGEPSRTAEVMHDGWYVTGDMAKEDTDGFLTITGRQSRFSKIGGEMVPHIRVEEVIQAIIDQTQPCTLEDSDDGECAEVAVTSLPCPDKGEKLIVLHTPLDMPVADLHSALQQSDLPKLWIPRLQAFVEVDQIPKLGSGKFDLRGITSAAETALEH